MQQSGKYTAQKMKFYLINTKNKSLDYYKVKASDREYQFWERNFLSIDLWSKPVFMQKLNYIHNNPIAAKWKLCEFPGEYKFVIGFVKQELMNLVSCPVIMGRANIVLSPKSCYWVIVVITSISWLQVTTPCNGSSGRNTNMGKKRLTAVADVNQ